MTTLLRFRPLRTAGPFTQGARTHAATGQQPPSRDRLPAPCGGLMRLALAGAPAAVALLLGTGIARADVLSVTSTGDPAPPFRCPASVTEPCTLRAALGQNDDDGGGDTVPLPPGVYTMASTLEIRHDITVAAADPARPPVIDAGGGSGALIIAGTTPQGALVPIAVTLRDLTVTGSDGAPAVTAFEPQPLVLDHLVVRGNAAGGQNGGGLQLHGGTAELSGSTFSGDSAQSGGAVALDGNRPGALTISDSELDANRAGAGGLGGAIAAFSPGSQLVVERSRLSGNGAFEGGAVALPAAGDARLRIADSTFDANTAAGAGSAVWVSDDFPGGRAGLDLLSDTFLGGSAGTGGALGGTISDLALHDSVLAGNTGGSCSGAGVVSRGHNLTDDATCGLAGPGDRQGIDPRLDPLAANGGPTATAMPRSDSPLLDAADGGCDATDARGVPRPQGAACDIGATERSASAPRVLRSAAAGGVVSGLVDPGGEPTRVALRYGPAPAYGHTLELGVVAGWRAVPVTGRPLGLPAGLRVHVRLVARSAAGKADGLDTSFVTPPLRIRHLRVSVARARRSALVRWIASASAPVRFALVQTLRHRRTVRLAFTVGGRSGANSATVPSRLLRRLASGPVRILASATGHREVLARADFRLPRGRR